MAMKSYPQHFQAASFDKKLSHLGPLIRFGRTVDTVGQMEHGNVVLPSVSTVVLVQVCLTQT